MKGVHRRELLRAYQEWKGGNYQPADLHDAVRWRPHEDDPLMPKQLPAGKWKLVESQKLKSKSNGKIDRTRNAPQTPRARKKRNTHGPAPVGMIWDALNYSCAYDALFTVMYSVWDEHGAKWTAMFSELGTYSMSPILLLTVVTTALPAGYLFCLSTSFLRSLAHYLLGIPPISLILFRDMFNLN